MAGRCGRSQRDASILNVARVNQRQFRISCALHQLRTWADAFRVAAHLYGINVAGERGAALQRAGARKRASRGSAVPHRS